MPHKPKRLFYVVYRNDGMWTTICPENYIGALEVAGPFKKRTQGVKWIEENGSYIVAMMKHCSLRADKDIHSAS